MQIKTTGDLRALLSQAIEDVKSGKMSIEKAGSIQKIAGRINESIYAEAKILLMINPQMKEASLGNLELHKPPAGSP